jgi:plasmid stabilization system protein ParE
LARALIFSQRAEADLIRLKAFLKPKSPKSAAKAVARIIESLDLLLLFPHSGVIVRNNTRRLVLQFGKNAYVVRYPRARTSWSPRIWHSLENRPRA